MPRRIFDLFLFSSLYIALCAVLMAYQVTDLLKIIPNANFLWFVFFSTICSYNFHWYLTPDAASENRRIIWTHKHKHLHLVLILISVVLAFLFFIPLIEFWMWIGFSMLLTFLYSAPKLPLKPAHILRRIAVGKTIFLALVWMYVTSILPIIITGVSWQPVHTLFCVSRFFFIYAICIIFDFRDREQDKQDGIKSMITQFNEKGINFLFIASILIYLITTVALAYYGIPINMVALLILPGLIVSGLYTYLKKNFSDYLYYFLLDGMMALPALLTSLLSF
jgi:4-hydroxybenzoate polyprenyltransferase